jgi:hypothetical protein
MLQFAIGEEVLHEDRRYVVSTFEPGPHGRVRLLATTPHGTEVVWTTPGRLHKIDAYTRPNDDTDRNARQAPAILGR